MRLSTRVSSQMHRRVTRRIELATVFTILFCRSLSVQVIVWKHRHVPRMPPMGLGLGEGGGRGSNPLPQTQTSPNFFRKMTKRRKKKKRTPRKGREERVGWEEGGEGANPNPKLVTSLGRGGGGGGLLLPLPKPNLPSLYFFSCFFALFRGEGEVTTPSQTQPLLSPSPSKPVSAAACTCQTAGSADAWSFSEVTTRHAAIELQLLLSTIDRSLCLRKMRLPTCFTTWRQSGTGGQMTMTTLTEDGFHSRANICPCGA